MPMIPYRCQNCGKTEKGLVRASSVIANTRICKHCGGEAKRQLGAPASISKVVIDDGVHPKSVEIMPDILEIREKINNHDPTKAD